MESLLQIEHLAAHGFIISILSSLHNAGLNGAVNVRSNVNNFLDECFLPTAASLVKENTRLSTQAPVAGVPGARDHARLSAETD